MSLVFGQVPGQLFAINCPHISGRQLHHLDSFGNAMNMAIAAIQQARVMPTTCHPHNAFGVLFLRGWIDIKDRSQLIPTRRFIHYRCGFPTPVLARRLLVRARHLLVHAFGVGWPDSARQKNRL
jgi:hypothetical protein